MTSSAIWHRTQVDCPRPPLLPGRTLLLPSVAAVIRDAQGQLLLRGKAESQGWSLPAGEIEPGDTPGAALHREVLEETGRRVVSYRLSGAFEGADYRHTYPNGNEVEYTVLLFRCEVTEPHGGGLDPEMAELRFFCRKAMRPLALPYRLGVLFGKRSPYHAAPVPSRLRQGSGPAPARGTALGLGGPR